MITFYWLCLLFACSFTFDGIGYCLLGFSVATLICFFCLLLGGVVVTLVY